MPIKILITGTDGFIGSYLKNYLENKGFRIYGTVFRRNAGPQGMCARAQGLPHRALRDLVPPIWLRRLRAGPGPGGDPQPPG